MNKEEFKQILRETIAEEVPLAVDKAVAKAVPIAIDTAASKSIALAVPEAVNKAVASAMGVMQENFNHQFGLMNEKLDLFRESVDRRFDAVDDDISHIKTRLNDIAIDVEGLKKDSVAHDAGLSWRRS